MSFGPVSPEEVNVRKRSPMEKLLKYSGVKIGENPQNHSGHT